MRKAPRLAVSAFTPDVMNAADSIIRLVGQTSDETKERLRDVLLDAASRFGTYRGMFERLGISKESILKDEPLTVLRRLPLLDGDALNELIDESVRVGEQIIDMETSSGTTGPRKRRFISHADDVSETEFLAELFRVCGITALDRVACLDADPLTLMVSFTKALDFLGVEEAYAYCAGTDFNEMLANLPKLDPSVIISIPSILERCFESLNRYYENAPGSSLKKIVYAGERMPDGLRSHFESDLGVEVFGYYGASETSALGIECDAHDGIHLFTDRNIVEIVTDTPSGLNGEIVVTTLHQRTLPLLRYPLNDVISLKEGECPCGLNYPRVDVLGRTDDGFSILGAKLHYRPILNACYNGQDGPRLMRLVLSRTDREKLEIVLPKSLEASEKGLRDAIFKSQPDLDFLTGSKYLDISFSFVDEASFDDSRKQRRVIDLR